jgi:hypothetical protein
MKKLSCVVGDSDGFICPWIADVAAYDGEFRKIEADLVEIDGSFPFLSIRLESNRASPKSAPS